MQSFTKAMDAEVSWDFLTCYQCVCACVLSCELTMRLFHDWHGVQEGINLDDRSGGMCMYLCLRACVCLCIKQIPLPSAFCEPSRSAEIKASASNQLVLDQVFWLHSVRLQKWITCRKKSKRPIRVTFLLLTTESHWSAHCNQHFLSIKTLLLLILNLFLQQNSAVLQMQNQTVKHGAAKGWRHNARVSVCLLQVC